MNIFFSNTIQNNAIVLPEDETRHCVKVLRKEKGDRINCIDGKGNYYEAEISEITKKYCICKIISHTPNFGCFPYTIRMGVAPTKNMDRFEFFVEKAVELGVSEIIPLRCKHSERKQVKTERIEKIALSAMKQSLKAQKPIIHEITPLETVLNMQLTGGKYIAHCQNQNTISLKKIPRDNEITILIGPEGDFSTEEINLAVKNTWEGLDLGPSRLRTETAAIVAVHSVHFLWQ